LPGKRQQIVNAVKERFALITTANGYQTDIGLKQTEWNPGPKGADPEADELPGHDIRDEVETTVVKDKNAGSYDRELEIVVIAELKEADATATLARKALEDMIKAVSVDPTWGSLARRTIPLEEDINVDELGQQIGAARLKFKVEYSRRPWEA
jgi:hypothetical protein